MLWDGEGSSPGRTQGREPRVQTLREPLGLRALAQPGARPRCLLSLPEPAGLIPRPTFQSSSLPQGETASLGSLCPRHEAQLLRADVQPCTGTRGAPHLGPEEGAQEGFLPASSHVERIQQKALKCTREKNKKIPCFEIRDESENKISFCTC